MRRSEGRQAGREGGREGGKQGGGGALVLPPFIVSKVSVSCSRLIGHVCKERERGRACDERTGEESEHVSILTHQREQRKQQQTRRRDSRSRRKEKRKEGICSEGHICSPLSGRRTISPLILPPSFLLLFLPLSAVTDLLRPGIKPQRQRDAGEDAEEDGEDEEMTGVCVWESLSSSCL